MIERLPLSVWPDGQLLTILLYHRVLAERDPMRPGEIVAEDFDRSMSLLARHFSVLPLTAAVDGLVCGRLPKRACCITFDDGYADNLTVALPILERYGLPATVFVATGYLDGGRMFNDSATEIVARAPGDVLDLRAIGLGQHDIGSIEKRLVALGALLGQLKYLAPERRMATVEKMTELAACGPLPDDLMLTSDQVRELARRGVEIGGHTVDHTILTTLDDAAARTQLAEGKRALERLVGRPVRTLAYPNGKPGRDYDARHVAMAGEIGFELAVSTSSGVANRTTDRYQLPRFTPWSRSPIKSAIQLTRNAWNKRPQATCS